MGRARQTAAAAPRGVNPPDPIPGPPPRAGYSLRSAHPVPLNILPRTMSATTSESTASEASRGHSPAEESREESRPREPRGPRDNLRAEEPSAEAPAEAPAKKSGVVEFAEGELCEANCRNFAWPPLPEDVRKGMCEYTQELVNESGMNWYNPKGKPAMLQAGEARQTRFKQGVAELADIFPILRSINDAKGAVSRRPPPPPPASQRRLPPPAAAACVATPPAAAHPPPTQVNRFSKGLQPKKPTDVVHETMVCPVLRRFMIEGSKLGKLPDQLCSLLAEAAEKHDCKSMHHPMKPEAILEAVQAYSAAARQGGVVPAPSPATRLPALNQGAAFPTRVQRAARPSWPRRRSRRSRPA